MMTRRTISKLEYISDFDSKILKETFLSPLKRKSKSGQELYSKRDSEKIISFYKAIIRKQQAKQRVLTSWKGGFKKQSISYWIPRTKKSKIYVPFKGKKAWKVEGIIERRKHAISLKRFKQGTFKDIGQKQELTKNQLRHFKRLLGDRGFTPKGMMSRQEGYMYRLWIQRTYGEDYNSLNYSYGSNAMSEFQTEAKSQSYFDFLVDYVKETYE